MTRSQSLKLCYPPFVTLHRVCRRCYAFQDKIRMHFERAGGSRKARRGCWGLERAYPCLAIPAPDSRSRFMSSSHDSHQGMSDWVDSAQDGMSIHLESDALGGSPIATADAPKSADNRAPAPFVWQHGTRLILLDDDPRGWVMAELSFQAELCRYVEVRRAVYSLTREAIGAVLSRALASGEHAAVDVALSLHEWLSAYYGIAVITDVIAPPDASSVEFTV
jgi:hypothetical protein